MPTRLNTNFPPFNDPDEFESLIRDICALEWNDPNTDKFGRKGQKQHGVDVYGQPINLNGEYYASQCKLRTKKEQLTEQEIENEITEARQFPHKLKLLTIATDAPRDTHTQILIDNISQREMRKGSFRVIIWFWDNITERLAAYPKLIVKYYPDFYANLTSLSIVERLVDVPLQIVTITQASSNTQITIKDALEFRGVRILQPNQSASVSANSALTDVMPDGVLCIYHAFFAGTVDSSLLRLASTLQNYLQQVENLCPVFVVLSPSWMDSFFESFEKLGGNLSRIKILDLELPLNELADQILQSVFNYGYARRGRISTIDFAIRTKEGKLNSVLLDLDWQSRLSTTHFPTPDEWENIFVPTLSNIRKLLLNQSDRTRIQINCQLPLPAAFALGFFFNLRVARIGVWARKRDTSDFKQQFWLSDGDSVEEIFEPEYLQLPSGLGQTAIVELTSYVAIHKAVEVFVKKTNLVPDTWLQMRLSSKGKPIENINESYATAYANQVGQIIRQLNEQGVTDVHLFARIPSPLAILIGQRLHACGRIYLYWFNNPTYQFAFVLK